MGPNSSYDYTDNGVIINGTEYGPEIFGEDQYFPPHALDFMWSEIDLKEVARGFDGGEEYGSDILEDEASRVVEMYNALDENAKFEMHTNKLRELNERIRALEPKLEWLRIYSMGLLATLNEYKGPAEYKRIFENSIKRIVENAEHQDFELRSDLDEEQEWEA